jgi:hypothetical protein
MVVPLRLPPREGAIQQALHRIADVGGWWWPGRYSPRLK